MNIKVMYSKNTDDWKTPKALYDPLIKKGYIDTFKYHSNYNELEKNYINKKLFINPPYSKMKEITDWIIKQIENGNKIIMIIPARTETKYFQKLLNYNPRIYLINKRLHYNESKSAPFPTIALIFNRYFIQTYDYGSIEKLLEKYS